MRLIRSLGSPNRLELEQGAYATTPPFGHYTCEYPYQFSSSLVIRRTQM